MKADDVITGIMVTYKTTDLVKRAYESVRKFHPEMKIIIVDGSGDGDPCRDYVKSVSFGNTFSLLATGNIGHGRGMVLGMQYTKTPFVLLFDSDTEMLKSPVQAMLDMMEDDTYGVGYIEKTAFDGHEYGCKSEHLKQGWMRYLHPYFCLIQLKEYRKYNPFIHHGAPAVNTCLDIHRRGLSSKVIKEFPGLGHSSGKGWVWEGKPREFVRHDTAGTRSWRRRKNQEEIEGKWERVVDPGGITCITCTGDRPGAFELCQRWMKNQTVIPDQWIIIDDGRTPMQKPEMGVVEYFYRKPNSNDPKHTLVLNIKEAIKRISHGKILFIEDDEYYAPMYVEEMSSRLDKYELVGIGRNRYYYLPMYKWHLHENMGHASLAQTAFKKSFFDKEIVPILEGDSFFDLRIWRIVNGKEADHKTINESISESISIDGRALIFDDRNNPLYVGMKGLPGRKGIGSGHYDNSWYKQDHKKQMLKKWISIKEDFEAYLVFPEVSVPETSSMVNSNQNNPFLQKIRTKERRKNWR